MFLLGDGPRSGAVGSHGNAMCHRLKGPPGCGFPKQLHRPPLLSAESAGSRPRPHRHWALRLESAEIRKYPWTKRGREGRVSSPVFALRPDSSLEHHLGITGTGSLPVSCVALLGASGSPSDGDVSGCPAHALDVPAVGVALREIQSHVSPFSGKVATLPPLQGSRGGQMSLSNCRLEGRGLGSS